MKKLICFIAMLALFSGCALGEIPEETRNAIRSELGVCSIDAYDGKVIPTLDRPYSITDLTESGDPLTTWDILWDNDDDGYSDETFTSRWFRPEGIIAEETCDLDRDNMDELLVLYNVYDLTDGYSRNQLMLRIYEQSDVGLMPADEVMLIREFDAYCCYINVLLTRQNGPLQLFVQNIVRIDGYTNCIREITYDGAHFHASNGFGRLAADAVRQWDLYPESEPVGDCLEFGNDDDRLYLIYQDDHAEEEAARDFDECLRRIGLGWTDFYNFEGNLYDSLRAIHAKDAIQLAKFDMRGQYDEEGHIVARLQFKGIENSAASSVLRTTGSVNLRSAPNLEGEILGSVEVNTLLEWTGNTSTDERGVIWYNVSKDGKNCWVSSKYAQID